MIKNELHADSVFKYINGRELLTDCFLRCETGEVVGILGRNGCGKSTFLKIIFGTVDCHHKYVSINGKRYEAPYKTAGLMAYLPQQPFLPGTLTVREVIDVFTDSEDEKNNVSDDEYIRPHLSQKVNALSGGERRYLEILLLVNSAAAFILLDEPFNALDPLTKERVMLLIHAYRSKKGFIITDHDYRHIIAASDRIILVANGSFQHIHALTELEDKHYLPPGSLAFSGLI
ncbi:ATP-binding cassette domain-containing protein [Chitinophaga arvensicola]|uniref:ABC-type multidrug transport system, ATPase component n=1 Tax=Chitinophaga arvensicola TaxID=29529 RepID=A0A1I0S508_9BACT|nr:ATP-binding cassette domain-containing protein [Chitinophaga arvensicola]SEW49763.1 ABC-type multidrug transport system, ATPase component [Chitinophaga arvensicola]